MTELQRTDDIARHVQGHVTRHKENEDAKVSRDEDLIEEAEGSRTGTEEGQEITRLHWVPKKRRSNCYNPECKKRFTTLRPSHNCRRCGEVFCGSCVQHFLLLNTQAQPDLSGQKQKVCKQCHDIGKLMEVDGPSRSHTDYFKRKRAKHKERPVLERAPESKPEEILNWMHSKLDLDRECERLLNGFEKMIGKSKIKQARMTSEKWQKPNIWIMGKSTAKSCGICQTNFTLKTKRSYCRVCGLPLCKASECSDKDLLLYVPNKDKKNNTPRKPKLAIIRFDGSPEVEPDISLYLRVCPSCKKKLREKQAEEHDIHEEGGHQFTTRLFIQEFKELYERIQAVENQVNECMSMLLKTVELLEAGERDVTQGTMNEMENREKSLSGNLQLHLTMTQGLRKLKPPSNTKSLTLLKNYEKAKEDFYFNQKSELKALQWRLGGCIPAGSFDAIRRMMQEDPLRGAHIHIHQLCIEVSSLCEDKKLRKDVSLCLEKLNTAVVQDMEEEDRGKSDEQKKQILDSIVNMAKDRAQSNKLIPVSLHTAESKNMYTLILYVLNEIREQLEPLWDQHKFQHVKLALTNALEEIQDCQSEDHQVQPSLCCICCFKIKCCPCKAQPRTVRETDPGQ